MTKRKPLVSSDSPKLFEPRGDWRENTYIRKVAIHDTYTKDILRFVLEDKDGILWWITEDNGY